MVDEKKFIERIFRRRNAVEVDSEKDLRVTERPGTKGEYRLLEGNKKIFDVKRNS